MQEENSNSELTQQQRFKLALDRFTDSMFQRFKDKEKTYSTTSVLRDPIESFSLLNMEEGFYEQVSDWIVNPHEPYGLVDIANMAFLVWWSSNRTARPDNQDDVSAIKAETMWKVWRERMNDMFDTILSDMIYQRKHNGPILTLTALLNELSLSLKQLWEYSVLDPKGEHEDEYSLIITMVCHQLAETSLRGMLDLLHMMGEKEEDG
jgi:hypothetical protein